MKFGEVLDALQSGKMLRRPAWPAGEFIFLVPGSSFIVSRAPLLGLLAAGTQVSYRPHIDRHYGDGTIGPFNFQHAEILGSNWEYFAPTVIEAITAAATPVAPVAVVEPAATPAVVEPPAPTAPVVEAPAAVIEAPPAPVVAAPVAHVATPEKPAFTTVWLIEVSPTQPIFTPEYWSAAEGKFVGEANSATPYATMQDAVSAAKLLSQTAPQKTRIVHHARAA